MNLFEKESLDKVKGIIKDSQTRLEVNDLLMMILHGNMTRPLELKLKKDMPETYKDAIDRLMPINFLKRINDKITHIYQTGVKREVDPETDQTALDEYVKDTRLNDELNYNNELLNTFGYSLQSLAVDEDGKNYSVAVDNNKFIPVNFSRNRKNKMDMLILVMDKINNSQIYWVWTDKQFAIIDQDGKIRWELMQEQYEEPIDMSEESLENPYGKIPYEYITTSRTSIMPEVAYDILQISLCIPLLMTDIAYVSKFTAFSILWTIDIDTDKLPHAPNATWNLKSGGGEDLGEAKPQIGTLKPDGDTDKMISLTLFMLGAWLESMGIPSGGIGKIDGGNLSSGISKIIDELDISDLREKQTKIYQDFERRYFDKYFHYLNPVFITSPDYDDVKHSYSPNAEVITTFPIQRPIINRMEVLNEIEKELNLGLITKRQALVKLYPELSEADIDAKLAEIEIPVVAANANNDDEQEGEDDEA
jgi:hypothetical protein